jgi:hypothetical protein
MWFNEKNFLTDIDFKKLNTSTLNFYTHAKEECDNGRYKQQPAVQKAKRVRCWVKDKEDAEEDSLKFFGDEYAVPLQRIRNFYKNIGFKNIKLHNAWIQYGDRDTIIDNHVDGAIRGADIDKCFTSLLFCHEYWDDNWGGTFHVTEDESDVIISPTPNSFVTWTRDTPHMMSRIISDCPLRIFLGTSWYEK